FRSKKRRAGSDVGAALQSKVEFASGRIHGIGWILAADAAGGPADPSRASMRAEGRAGNCYRCRGRKARPDRRAFPFSRKGLVDRLILDRGRRGAADGNLAGLLALGQLALEVDMEQPVLEGRALDLDMVGELEA